MINILKATYGGKDVTGKLKSLVKNGELRVKACNSVFGDLAPGVFKHLFVEYDGGTKSIPEGAFLTLPESKNKRLGIYYTNNNVDKVVNYTLHNLSRFKDKADILTCVWKAIPDNPFYEIGAMTKSGNHLNIVIQILQLLYTAKNSGDYEYVSFLEHDVLYPDGYFDFPDFKTGVLTNMNYMGISEHGYQNRNAAHEPLHQMTMRFGEAVTHFENLFKEALQSGQVLLEPNDNRSKWECPNPAIHVNHGKHFTSHFSIYGFGEDKDHPYWGNFKELSQKLF
jgi:hypothetical protein